MKSVVQRQKLTSVVRPRMLKHAAARQDSNLPSCLPKADHTNRAEPTVLIDPLVPRSPLSVQAEENREWAAQHAAAQRQLPER